MFPITARRVGLAMAVVLAVGSHALVARGPRARPSWATQVDRVFQPWDSRESPGCALGVFQDGQIAYEHGYGTADLEHDVPIAPDSVFYVGSLSKQFTAMAAALAIQQGKLAYDDSIRKYLPELPPHADAIEVSHLLHHTSGLRDYYALLAIAGRRWDEPWDNRAVLEIAARQKNLNFSPGTEYGYSNTGYTLLATVVERAAGTPFAAFMDATVFKPLGMTSTLVHTDEARLIKGRAIGYSGTAGQWTLDTPHNERSGAGGLYTNIPDLQRWDENFYTARVGGRDLIERIQTPARLADGKAIAYAWGLEVGTYRGLRVVQHGGSLGGYRAHLLRFPEQHTSVAVLCNLGSIRPEALADRVADVVLARELQEAAGSRVVAGPGYGTLPTVPPPVDVLRAYEGTYYSDELQATFTLMVRDRSLELRRDTDATARPVTYRGPDEFGSAGFTMHFRRDVTAMATGFTVDAGRIRGIEFVRKKE